MSMTDIAQAITTLITVAYILLGSFVWPRMFNYWAVLALDIFGVIFWLITFPILAVETIAFSIVDYAYDDSCDYYDCYYVKRGLAKRATTDWTTYRNAMAAAAGISGLEL
jgi:hypothetical protein